MVQDSERWRKTSAGAAPRGPCTGGSSRASPRSRRRASPRAPTPRVQLVRREGRDVSSQYRKGVGRGGAVRTTPAGWRGPQSRACASRRRGYRRTTCRTAGAWGRCAAAQTTRPLPARGVRRRRGRGGLGRRRRRLRTRGSGWGHTILEACDVVGHHRAGVEIDAGRVEPRRLRGAVVDRDLRRVPAEPASGSPPRDALLAPE